MQKILFLFLVLAYGKLHAQADILILEKNGSNVVTYSTGMSISMETIYNQWLDGVITDMRNDSVFVNGMPFHYKEIEAIRTERKKFHSKGLGTFLMAAGAGVLVLGAVNGLYRGDPANTWYAPMSYATAGVFLLGGYLLTIKPYKNYTIGKTYTLQYLKLGVNKKP